MNHKTVRLLLAVFFLFGVVTSALAQGLYWESKMTGASIGEETQQMWAVPKKMKGVTKETGEAYIVRLDKQVFITVDPKDKTYSEITFDEMEKMMKKASGKMDAQMAEMQKQLADMPEEQRKMVEKMMGSKIPTQAKDVKTEVVNTGEKKTISGFACTKLVVKMDDKEAMTFWVTKEVKEFDSMRKDWEEFSKLMMEMNPSVMKGLGDVFKKIEGFPIQTEVIQGIVNTVTKVEKKVAPASEFEVPAGYKKVAPKMMEEMDKMDKEN